MFVTLAACSSDDTVPATETVRSPEQQLRDRAPEYIIVQQAEIKKRLKDPESAQFRNSAFYDSRVPVVCGEVNSRNSFGGYTGFQRFVAAGEVTRVESEMAAGEMDKVWAQFCTN